MKSSLARLGSALTLLAICVPLLLPAGPIPAGKPLAYPAWWFEGDVIRRLNPANQTPVWPDDYATADDYAAVNQGQVKNIAKQAYEEMKAKLPGGAGSTLSAIWETPATSTDDYRAINLGQLKNVAEPFYARLQELNYTGQPLAAGQTRPWGGAADDYALANIGQVKNLFSFIIPDLPLDPNDTDADGLPDVWEQQYWSSLSHGATEDSDSDGVDNITEYRQGRNPTKGAINDVSGVVGLRVFSPAP